MYMCIWDCRAATVKLICEVEADLEKVDSTGRTQLHWAAQHGDIHIVQVLLGAGSIVNATDPAGYMPLYQAALERHQDVCKVLLAGGAQPNELDDVDHCTSLHCAAWWKGHVPVVQLLLQHGAEQGARNRAGQTALDLACQFGHTGVVNMLHS
ncbi:ankyrin repeat domain-containing protein 39-like [Periplaneta americana]|uniref:ankyrin repeat domain-containing protein 39-like n=1 Tax=Periplaneta americana TaxID=6978 RepID=UPI0037E84440